MFMVGIGIKIKMLIGLLLLLRLGCGVDSLRCFFGILGLWSMLLGGELHMGFLGLLFLFSVLSNKL